MIQSQIYGLLRKGEFSVDNNNSYVFISYAHKDSAIVLPCIEAMKKKGVNLWYDEGIAAGSEWPEYIAQKVVGCAKFVLFISNAYLQSQNCKRELNFAISRKKDILSVYIQDVNLSPGMEMQLGTYQAIYRNRFDSAIQFHNAMANEPYFDGCRILHTETVKPQEPSQPTPQTVSQESVHVPVQKPAQDFSSKPTTESQIGNIINTQYNDLKTSCKDAYKQCTDTLDDWNSKIQEKMTTDNSTNASDKPLKKRNIVVILAFFLGIFGAQRFYLRQWPFAFPYIILTLLGLGVISAIASVIEILFIVLAPKETVLKVYRQEFI